MFFDKFINKQVSPCFDGFFVPCSTLFGVCRNRLIADWTCLNVYMDLFSYILLVCKLSEGLWLWC